ncbi:MAG: hypothetical protein ACKVOM_03900 [Ferruginibacter sp.]
MLRIYQTALITATLFLSSTSLYAQEPTNVSVDPTLKEIYSSKIPKKYTIAGINVIGSKSFDKNLIISISGLAIGDEVQIPGTDVFNKAIVKLWKQSLVSSAEINITRLEDSKIYIEIIVQERPRLINFSFEGVKKGDKDDLVTNTMAFRGIFSTTI